MKQAKIDEGTLVAIRSRRCADTVQPHVRRGMVLQVRKVSTLATGGTRLECVEHEATAPGRPRRVTVNSDRFEWSVVSERMVEEAARRGRTAYEQLRAERREVEQARAERREVEQARLDRALSDGLHRDAAKKTDWLMSHLTFAEQALISIIPHIVAEAAWLAAERARQWAVDHRVGALVKVNRAIKHLREEHDRRLTIYLDAPHRADLTTRAHNGQRWSLRTRLRSRRTRSWWMRISPKTVRAWGRLRSSSSSLLSTGRTGTCGSTSMRTVCPSTLSTRRAQGGLGALYAQRAT